jgi:hypothetical protein
MTKDEALDLALEALEYIENNYMSLPKSGSEAITAIKQARSAQAQEPVAIVDEDGVIVVCNYKYKPGDKLYTTPPAAQRPWVGLTDDEFENIELGCRSTSSGKIEAMQKVEAKLKEKNGLHRQHVIDGSPCWCEPETSYTDPETGASVVVHKEPQ